MRPFDSISRPLPRDILFIMDLILRGIFKGARPLQQLLGARAEREKRGAPARIRYASPRFEWRDLARYIGCSRV